MRDVTIEFIEVERVQVASNPVRVSPYSPIAGNPVGGS